MRNFVIRKYCHYSNVLPKFYRLPDSFMFTSGFIFTDSCRYTINEPSCVNKLFGFCFGFGVHRNSVRFGWTYEPIVDRIHIWKYIYKDGRLNKQFVKAIDINEPHSFDIQLLCKSTIGDYKVKLYIDDALVGSCEFTTNSRFITTLSPYFGGHTRAPHKIVIKQFDYDAN